MALLRALKHKNFSRLYYAGLTSELGSFLSETALSLLLFDISQKNTAMLGTMRALFLISMTLGNIFGGPLGEKFNRKNVLIATEIFRIPAIFLLLSFQTPWIIILSVTFIAFFTGVFRPTRQTLVNDIVPPHDMRNANSLFASTFAILHITGPFFGALLYAYFNGVNQILLFDLSTYFIGIYLLKKISWKSPVKSESFSFFDDFKAGLKYVGNRLDIKAILINNCLAGFNIGILIPLLIPHTTATLGWTKSEYGILMAGFGVGGLLGGMAAASSRIKIHLGKLIIGLLIIESLFFIIFNFITNAWMGTVFFAVWGFCVFLRVSNQLNFFSTTVETQYLNRVMSIAEMSFITPNILGSALVGMLGNIYPTTTILYGASGLFFSSLIIRLFMKDTQELKKASLEQVHREAFHDTIL